MIRGLFFGLFWGSLLSVAALTAVSLTSPVSGPSQDAVAAEGSEEPEITVPETVEEDVVAPEPVEETPVVAEADVSEPEAEKPVSEDIAVEAPVVVEESPAQAEVEAPATSELDVDVAIGNPTGDDVGGLVAPSSAEGAVPTIETSEEAPLARQPATAAATPADADTLPVLEPSSGKPPKVATAGGTLEAPSESAQATAPTTQTGTNPQGAAPKTALVTDTEADAPQVATATPAPPKETPKPKSIAINLPVIENPVTPETTEIAEDVPSEPDTEIAVLGTPTQGTAATNSFTSRSSGSSRLPTVGSGTTLAKPITESRAAPQAGALATYAADFDSTDLPLLSIILIDEQGAGIPREQLKNIQVPVTIAIDPLRPDAAAAAAEYRSTGLEVVALLDGLANEASPTDVEVTLEGFFNAMAETVAVLDPTDARLQKNRQLLASVLGVIKRSGHGMITYDQGLNAAEQAAARQGVPAAAIFRVLDAENEQAPKIKRYLERAAFNANRDGSVVVLGRNRPETIAAILEWSLERKTSGLAIGPVSAVMRSQ